MCGVWWVGRELGTKQDIVASKMKHGVFLNEAMMSAVTR